ncbi:MFS transporter [Streptomyces sp. NPDC051907]|uniref:MFS transporter n=1 Tax=Streptomyces sp. NPDC051907 TaxID=3155284 RepID=UPI00342E464F
MRKWGPLLAVSLGTFMLLLDVTVLIVALPDMAGALDASLTDLQWVIDIYALVLAALLLGAGSAADVLGARRLYLWGTAMFAAASLGCGLASGPESLIVMRGIQGLGAAAMFATTLSLLGAAYQGRDRSVALGVWGAISGAAAAVGPVLGGVLTQAIDWRWIFFINLPVSVAAVWATLRAVRPSERSVRRIDWAGTAAFAVFAGAATYGVVRAGEAGWASARTGGWFLVAAAGLGAFVVVERRAADPLIDLSLFRRSSFVTVMAAGMVYNAAAFGVLPYTSIWLQTVLGMSPLTASLALLPQAVVAFTVAAVSSRLLHGVQRRWVIGGGMLLIGAGTLGQAVLDAGSSWAALTAGLMVAGVGVGVISPALAGAALASVPPRNAGMAGGAVNTFRQLGYALGVAGFGAVAASQMARSLSGSGVEGAAEAAHTLAGGGAGALRAGGAVTEEALRSAFASGLNTAAAAAGVAGLLAGAAALVWLRAPAEESGQVRTKDAVTVERP